MPCQCTLPLAFFFSPLQIHLCSKPVWERVPQWNRMGHLPGLARLAAQAVWEAHWAGRDRIPSSHAWGLDAFHFFSASLQFSRCRGPHECSCFLHSRKQGMEFSIYFSLFIIVGHRPLLTFLQYSCAQNMSRNKPICCSFMVGSLNWNASSAQDPKWLQLECRTQGKIALGRTVTHKLAVRLYPFPCLIEMPGKVAPARERRGTGHPPGVFGETPPQTWKLVTAQDDAVRHPQMSNLAANNHLNCTDDVNHRVRFY